MSNVIPYTDAIWPESLYSEFRILGIRLRPISAAHLLTLEKFQSPFFTGEFEILETDVAKAQDHLLFAALVVSMTHKELKQWFSQPDYKDQLFSYGQQLREKNPDDFNIKGLLSAEFLTQEYIRFFEYINAPLKTPDYVNNFESDQPDCGGHRLQGLLLIACGKCGYSREEAFDEYIQLVMQDVYKHYQDIGLIRLMTPEQTERRDNWQKYINYTPPKEEVACQT